MIEVEQLSRRYGTFQAVDGVSFHIGSGEVVGLLGHNGAGKTTIMKMLTGFLEPSAGHVRIGGLEITEDRRGVQAKIGYLPENCPLYPEMTIIDFLEYRAALRGIPPRERGRAIRRAIAHTALEAKAGDRIGTLSRGYRQRVGVAQAILGDPEILILDEPTNGLDPSQILQMRHLLRERSERATLILSTHILQEVEAVCDRVLILQAGRLAIDTRLDALAMPRGLLVSLDREPDAAATLFQSLDFVRAHRLVEASGPIYHYALEVPDPMERAPAVARSVLEAGWSLYGLTPETRDLETLFGEAVETREAAHV